jgi:crotonobetainyl-CoA:carnitine CoA-transferase CaiB-like acyl-CoA transferase
MEDAWVKGQGLSLTRQTEGVGIVRTTGPTARLSRTPVQAGAPARPAGADGPEVVKDLGLGDKLDALVARRVVVVPQAAPELAASRS